MDEVIDEVVRFARRCRRTASSLVSDETKRALDALKDICDDLGKAWSGSWIGYQARIYTRSLAPRRPGERYDSEWGNDRFVSETRGDWVEWDHDAIVRVIEESLGSSKTSLEKLGANVKSAVAVFDEVKGEVLPLLDAFRSSIDDTVIRERREKIAKLNNVIGPETYARVSMPKQFMSRDSIAMQEGIVVPPHLSYRCNVLAKASAATQLDSLADELDYVGAFLRRKHSMKGATAAKKTGPIFIGHGRSGLWKDLKDFLRDRLSLEYEEFNRVSTAGISIKERLEEMLDKCCFAFLLMTAEDEHKDGSLQARQNVVHEVGLFQGRYGFNRAIVLLEEGCAEFSNIDGLGQIRFPKGNLMAASEEIRWVLQREGIIS